MRQVQGRSVQIHDPRLIFARSFVVFGYQTRKQPHHADIHFARTVGKRGEPTYRSRQKDDDYLGGSTTQSTDTN